MKTTAAELATHIDHPETGTIFGLEPLELRVATGYVWVGD